MQAILKDGPLKGNDGVDENSRAPSRYIVLADNLMTRKEKEAFFAKLKEERMRVGIFWTPATRVEFIRSRLKKPHKHYLYQLNGLDERMKPVYTYVREYHPDREVDGEGKIVVRDSL